MTIFWPCPEVVTISDKHCGIMDLSMGFSVNSMGYMYMTIYCYMALFPAMAGGNH